jgi:hypothetical protein
MILWLSGKQSSMALSTAEAKYIAASVASHEAVWLQKLLARLFDLDLVPTLIYCNNQSCVNISRESSLSQQFKAYRDQIPFHPRHGA